ncbi:formyl transferase [Psychrosphaera aquimarina]|uniref:Formyl transferase n=1 Tax=Psychrosphaera aquimarina TaxID=2044854 RepID=A0ABU3QYA1_9GAMM|nr:formyl transferase [Psychrosphaera aquimarina]MDU0112419.1 formyl transferase [Psychrosphaera aquimarina]
MNILILANKDLASNHALNLLLPQIKQHKVTLCLSAKVGGNNPNKPTELNRLKFFEQDLFNNLLTPALKANYISESINANENNLYKTFDQLNCYLSQPVQELNKINQPEQLQMVAELKPDLIVCIRYGVILKEQVLAIPSKGTINLHSGILPDYRGVMATFWAMYYKEPQIGTTLHYIDDANIDTGNVIATSTLAVNYEKSYLWNVLQLYVHGVQLILNTINALASDQVISKSVQTGEGQYFTFPTTDDLTVFADNGHSLVDETEITEFITEHYLL